MKIKKERQKFRTANKRLIRGRRLYVYLCRDYIKNNATMDKIANRMQKAGLYTDRTYLRYTRQGIQSHLYRIEKRLYYPGISWHEWLVFKAMDPWTGYYKPIMEKQA